MSETENTYQITGNELTQICEAISKGYELQSLEPYDNVMSIVLTYGDEEDSNYDIIAMNFVR